MAKNALQAQLLKAGLVSDQKLKKTNRQQQHVKKTGQQDASLRQDIEQAEQQKKAKDLALDQQKKQQLEQKTLYANIKQMLEQHSLPKQDYSGDEVYQFIDQSKIKKIYVNPDVHSAIAEGRLAICCAENVYYVSTRELADRIEARATGFVVIANKKGETQPVDEEDPYAKYVIPDDLMW